MILKFTCPNEHAKPEEGEAAPQEFTVEMQKGMAVCPACGWVTTHESAVEVEEVPS